MSFRFSILIGAFCVLIDFFFGQFSSHLFVCAVYNAEGAECRGMSRRAEWHNENHKVGYNEKGAGKMPAPYITRAETKENRVSVTQSLRTLDLVRETGLEPVRCEPHAPQTCASASSATLALRRAVARLLGYYIRFCTACQPFFQSFYSF